MRPLLATAALLAAVGLAAPARSATSTHPLSINDQTDGVNHQRRTTVAVYCRKKPCKGTMALLHNDTKLASADFSIKPKTTFKIPMRLSHKAFNELKTAADHKWKVKARATLSTGHVVSHVITIKV